MSPGNPNSSYQGLARKWRPQTFADLVGQEDVSRSLANALRENKIPHGHILAGPRGVGKTTSARILARALNCVNGPTAVPCGKCRHCIDIANGSDLDVNEMDAASNTGIDHMRELLERVALAPFSARYKVYIIDEVHMLSPAAFNALLKTLEEPPPYVIFIFATTEMEKIPETVRSRCIIHNFRRLTVDDIVRRLMDVARGEGILFEEPVAREVFALIAQASDGGMRDALVSLDQLLAMTEGKLDPQAAQRMLGLTSHSTLADTVGWLAEGNAVELLRLIEDLVSRGRSLERFIKGLLAYLHDLMLIQAGAGVELIPMTGDALVRARELAGGVSNASVFNMLNQLFDLEERMKRSTQVRFLLEFTFLRMAVIKPVLPIEELMNRLKAVPMGPEPPPPPKPAANEPTPPRALSQPPVAESREAARPPLQKPIASAVMMPSAAMALRDSGAGEEDETQKMGSALSVHPLMGLARDELIETLVPHLPDANRFLGQYLRHSIAMRADENTLWIQWPKDDQTLSAMISRSENRKALEQTLTQLCLRPMTLRCSNATQDEMTTIEKPRRSGMAASFADGRPLPEPFDSEEPEPLPIPSFRPSAGAAPVLPQAEEIARVQPASLDVEGAKSLLQANPELSRRVKMVRDFFNGTIIDAAGRPVSI